MLFCINIILSCTSGKSNFETFTSIRFFKSRNRLGILEPSTTTIKISYMLKTIKTALILWYTTINTVCVISNNRRYQKIYLQNSFTPKCCNYMEYYIIKERNHFLICINIIKMELIICTVICTNNK